MSHPDRGGDQRHDRRRRDHLPQRLEVIVPAQHVRQQFRMEHSSEGDAELTVVTLAVAALAAMAHGAEVPPKASRTLDGETMRFPAKTIAAGVKATVGVCRSSNVSPLCHSSFQRSL